VAEGKKKFQAKLVPMGDGGAWTCLKVPFQVEEIFRTRARVAVKATLNGLAFRTSIFPDGQGSHFMMVNKAMQAGAGVKSGDSVKVVLEKDAAPRVIKTPRYLRAALSKDRKAEERFEKLSYSHKKEYLDWIESAKREETRARRIEKMLDMLCRPTAKSGRPF
jgi:hypothetical protein